MHLLHACSVLDLWVKGSVLTNGALFLEGERWFCSSAAGACARLSTASTFQEDAQRYWHMPALQELSSCAPAALRSTPLLRVLLSSVPQTQSTAA